jgi:hypothetical protein
VDANEQFVRKKWESVREQEQRSHKEAPKDWHGFVLALIDEYGHEELLASGNHKDRWDAAAEFTRQRLEEIRRVDAEISWLKDGMWEDGLFEAMMRAGDEEWLAREIKHHYRGARILAREQELLAALKRGLKASFDREGSVGK